MSNPLVTICFNNREPNLKVIEPVIHTGTECTTIHTGTDALDYLWKVNRKDLISQVSPFLESSKDLNVKFWRLRPGAICPVKLRYTDAGYDLTIIAVDQELAKNTVLYDTGICVSPPLGYYFEVVPRSSLAKSGYILTNSIGVIDNGYRGSIKIALTKISPEKDDVKLPFRCAQLILRKSYDFSWQEALLEYDTNRGNKGYGSSG